MAHYPAEHVMKCALYYSHFTQSIIAENTFFLRDASDAFFADPTGLATQIYNAAVTNLIPELSSWVVLQGVRLEDIRSLPYGGSDYPQTAQQGTAAATPKAVPTSTAFSIKKLTGTLGRSYRGRWYWPMWEGSDLSDADEVALTKAGNIVAALGAFQDGVETGTYPCEFGIVSFQHNGAVVNPGLFTRITGWGYSDLLVDSQRRRLLGRGR